MFLEHAHCSVQDKVGHSYFSVGNGSTVGSTETTLSSFMCNGPLDWRHYVSLILIDCIIYQESQALCFFMMFDTLIQYM